MPVIKNGRVIDPATNTDAPRDIRIEGEKIVEVAQPGSIRADGKAEVFDASGLIVAPGFIDLHANLRGDSQLACLTYRGSNPLTAGHLLAPRCGCRACSRSTFSVPGCKR